MKPLHQWTREEMLAFFKKSNFNSRIYFICCLLWILFCIYLYKTTGNAALKSNLYWLFITSFVIWYLITLRPMLKILRSAKRLEEFPDEKIGNYSKAELSRIFEEVLAISNNKEKPNIFILDIEVCNAFALNVVFLNFIKKLNSISISKVFFNHLTEDEIKAVLLHEMGHFNGYIYTENKVVSLSHWFFLILPFAFNCYVIGLYAKVCVAIIISSVLARLFVVIRKKTKEGEHALEYLCDLYASDHAGGLNMINALITLGRLNATAEEQSSKTVDKIKDALIPKRKAVNWTEFDTKIVNGKIEKEEYTSFINTMENTLNPQLLVNTLVDETSFTHPSLTDRVLFIHRNKL
jgi:Zn-dependent protease with chaperone function